LLQQARENTLADAGSNWLLGSDGDFYTIEEK